MAGEEGRLAGADIGVEGSAAVEIDAVPAVVELVFGKGRNRLGDLCLHTDLGLRHPPGETP